ncbi:MAG: RNA polymerase sigma factor [Saprospiraceae bacterium]
MEVTDKILLDAILSGNTLKRDWAFYQLYSNARLKNSIIQYVTTHGGNAEDGEDVFQEAMCIFDRNIRQNKFTNESTLFTYLFAIAKWHWVTYKRKHKKHGEFSNEYPDEKVESVEALFFEKEKKELLDMAIQNLDIRCQELLGYYKLDYSMKEITELLGFSSPAMAKKQAYRCRGRLRKVFLENPLLLKALNIEI